MRDATYRDYLWVRGEPLLTDGFGLAVITDATVEQVLLGMPPVKSSMSGSVVELQERAFDNHGRDYVFGVFEASGSVVLFELIPYFWNYPVHPLPTLSIGRSVAYHGAVRNGFFEWYEDGQLKTSFEPLFADSRDGSDPDLVLDTMRNVGGFDLDRDEDDPPLEEYLHHAATFALSEALTGVRLTLTMLMETPYSIYEVGA